VNGSRIHQQVASVRAGHVDLELDRPLVVTALDQELSVELRAALRDGVAQLPLLTSAATCGSYERSVALSTASDDVDVFVDAELRGLINASVAASGLGHRRVFTLMHDAMHRALDDDRLSTAIDGLDAQALAAQARENPPAIRGTVPVPRDFAGLVCQLVARLATPRPRLEPRAVLKAFLLQLIKLGRRSSAARQSAAERARLASRSAAASSGMSPTGIVLLSTRAPRGPNAPRTTSTQVIGGEQVAAA
jgi:hypothetical protein